MYSAIHIHSSAQGKLLNSPHIALYDIRAGPAERDGVALPFIIFRLIDTANMG